MSGRMLRNHPKAQLIHIIACFPFSFNKYIWKIMEYFSKSGTENGHDRGEKAKNHGTPPRGRIRTDTWKTGSLGYVDFKEKTCASCCAKGYLASERENGMVLRQNKQKNRIKVG